MRVLMICPELPRAESPGSMAPTARQIESLGKMGLEINTVDMAGIPKLKYLQVLPRIRRLAQQADLIHAHFGYCGWLAKLGPLLTRRRPPIVMSFMGDDLLGTPKNEAGQLEWLSRQMVRLNRILANQVAEVIVKSAQMAEVLAPLKVNVIPNGVDTQLFRPCARREACMLLGFDPDRLRVLFPGNPDNPRKGYQFAVAAVDVAARQLDGPLDLIPLWNVPPDQVSLYMNACDAMAMTSLIEGSPNVVKEGLACDLPIVGVPVGDVHQQLLDVPGCQCGERDANQFGHSLAEVLKTGRRSEGRRAIFDRGLDLESVAKKILNLYQRVLTQPIHLNHNAN
ncbi:glycosyltransferase [Planctomycetaceae bacterium SH139]